MNIDDESTTQLLAQELVSIIVAQADDQKPTKSGPSIDEFIKSNLHGSEKKHNPLDVLCTCPAVGYRASPLMVASILNQLATVKTLIEAGCSVDFVDIYGRTALTRVILSTVRQTDRKANDKTREDIVKTLIEGMGDSVNLKDVTGRNALLYAIENDDFISFEMLVKSGVDLNSSEGQDEDFNAISYAVALKRLSLDYARLLLENKADPNLRDHSGRTPLMFVNSVDKARLLIEYGADINCQDNSGKSVLMHVCLNDQVCEELINRGANIYLRDNFGKTVLDYSSKKPDSYCTKTCVKRNLEQLRLFFEESTPDDIRDRINEFVHTKNEDYFPIKDDHFSSVKLIPKIRACYQQKERFYEEFDKLSYFRGSDFQEKLFADVVHCLQEDNINLDGQSLRGRRIRVKKSADSNELNDLANLVVSKEILACDFYKLIIDIFAD